MNKEQKASIIRMRSEGMTFSEIANQLQLSINTVKSFYRRNAKTKSHLEACMHFGKPIVQTKHKRQKKFCSDKCRNAWWSAHPQNRRPKKLYSHICAHCGIVFQSDRAKSKYCSVKCFDDARRKENRIVEKVNFPIPKQPKAKRVAAYARVSSGIDEMLHSLSAQISYYSELIQSHPGWLYCGVFSDGKVSLPYKHFLGYERGENKGDPPVVNEEQAKLVRRIYHLFMSGKTTGGIARILTAENIPTPSGKQVWQPTTIESILKNEKYKGAARLQKKFTVDFLSKKNEDK